MELADEFLQEKNCAQSDRYPSAKESNLLKRERTWASSADLLSYPAVLVNPDSKQNLQHELLGIFLGFE
jgi:hypothetical protein